MNWYSNNAHDAFREYPVRNHPGDTLFERLVQAPLLIRSYNNQTAINSWLW